MLPLLLHSATASRNRGRKDTSKHIEARRAFRSQGMQSLCHFWCKEDAIDRILWRHRCNIERKLLSSEPNCPKCNIWRNMSGRQFIAIEFIDATRFSLRKLKRMLTALPFRLPFDWSTVYYRAFFSVHCSPLTVRQQIVFNAAFEWLGHRTKIIDKTERNLKGRS